MERRLRTIVLRSGVALLSLAMLQNVFAQAPGSKPSSEAGGPMDPGATPAFMVATVKPSNPDSSGGWAFPIEGNRVSCTNATLQNILVMAYGIHPRQVAGAPEWFGVAKYDISGIPDIPGDPNLKQIQEMYLKLLADRFQLKFHHEVRNIPIYALTIAKGGPKLTAADPNGHHNAGSSGGGGQRTLKFTSMSMPDFVLNMNFYEDRPVIDQTSLPDKYDFTLKWTYDLSREADPDAPPSLFTAIREQLGLRLDAVKGPADVFVIDYVDRPSAN